MERFSSCAVVAVSGTPRCGKTTVCRQFMAASTQKTEYIDLKSLHARNFLKDPALFFEESQAAVTVIDNFDNSDELIAVALRTGASGSGRKKMLLVGSSPSCFSKFQDLPTFEITPLSLLEVGSGARNQHWLRGGYPEAFNANSDKTALAWLENYIVSFGEGRFAAVGIPWAPGRTLNLLAMIAESHGCAFNENASARSLGISRPEIRSAVSALESGGIIRNVRSYSGTPKKRTVKRPALYIRDSGVLHALLAMDSREALLRSVKLQSSWEGYVIEQTISVLPRRLEISRYRTQDGTGLEIVVLDNGKPVIGGCVRWTRSHALNRGALEAARDLGTPENYLIVPEAEERLLHGGFTVVGIQRFLDRINSMKPYIHDKVDA